MKYLSLILLLLFITIVSSFTGCCNYREGLDANKVGTAKGAWGGSCACPDGQVYQVSDNSTYGKELACYGGISGPVNKTTGPWSGKSVTCAPKSPLTQPKPPLTQHIGNLANLVLGTGEFNTPLPSVNAIFLKRENPNIH